MQADPRPVSPRRLWPSRTRRACNDETVRTRKRCGFCLQVQSDLFAGAGFVRSGKIRPLRSRPCAGYPFAGRTARPQQLPRGGDVCRTRRCGHHARCWPQCAEVWTAKAEMGIFAASPCADANQYRTNCAGQRRARAHGVGDSRSPDAFES